MLKRREVAATLQAADVFIDLSDYQAFGRTSLEAMACATLAVVPARGGGDEYAIDGENALVVDTMDVAGTHDRLVPILRDRDRVEALKLAGLATAAGYSPRRAAMSELATFAPALAKRLRQHPAPIRPRLAILPELTETPPISITRSGHLRALSPYRQDALARDFATNDIYDGQLPEPGSADIVLLQRHLAPQARAGFTKWAQRFKAAGGKLIYDVDENLFDAQVLRYGGASDDVAGTLARTGRYLDAADLVTVNSKALFDLLSPGRETVVWLPDRLEDLLWTSTGQ